MGSSNEKGKNKELTPEIIKEQANEILNRVSEKLPEYINSFLQEMRDNLAILLQEDNLKKIPEEDRSFLDEIKTDIKKLHDTIAKMANQIWSSAQNIEITGESPLGAVRDKLSGLDAADKFQQYKETSHIQISEKPDGTKEKNFRLGALLQHVINNSVIKPYAGMLNAETIETLYDEMKNLCDLFASFTKEGFHSMQSSVSSNIAVNQSIENLSKQQREKGRFAPIISTDLGALNAKIKLIPQNFTEILTLVLQNSHEAIKQSGKPINEGRIEITSSDTTLEGIDYICIEIKDNGIGMSEEAKEHLFEPFYSTKPEGEGVGLTMSALYGSVYNNGGFIEVESNEGVGTTLKIYLPTEKDEDDEEETSGIIDATQKEMDNNN